MRKILTRIENIKPAPNKKRSVCENSFVQNNSRCLSLFSSEPENMLRNRPPQDQAVSNQSTGNVLTANVVQARQILRARDSLEFLEPNFNVKTSGANVLFGNANSITVSTNFSVSPGKTLTADSLKVTGTLISNSLTVNGNLSANELLVSDVLAANGVFGNLTVENHFVAENVATAETLTANILSVTSGGTAMLDALTVVPPLYLCPGVNAAVVWRISVDELTGNLQFQVSPNWDTRLSVSPSGP